MLLIVYIISIVIIALFVIYIVFSNGVDYANEVNKIDLLEKRFIQREKELAFLRAHTVPCMFNNLNDPRTCFFGSNYMCSWNEITDRCEKR